MKHKKASVDLARDVRWIDFFWEATRKWILNITILTFLLFSPFFGVETAAGPENQGAQISRSGKLILTWGDGKQGSGLSKLIVSLDDESGETTVLDIDPQSFGTMYGLNHRNVVARGQWTKAPGLANQVLQVSSIQVNEKNDLGISSDSSALALSGPQPWANVLCKFSDVTTEPEPLTYFNGLISETKPGLGHYWRENSYDQINILGSNSYGWYALPKTRAYYLGLSTTTMLNELFRDCTAVADGDIYFPSFVGINLMFNAELDGSAWGGSRYATFDGQSRFWYTTWEPPWGYANQTAIAHEMGHGFGLPHSSGDYGFTYDNQWDVMSSIWSNCYRSTDPTYGCLAQHTISFHKDILGWIPSNERFLTTSGSHTIALEQLTLPQTGNYRMAVIPINGSNTHFYTVEVRQWDGYDVKLPGEAVIIHEVDTTRHIPAHVVDADLNGNIGDSGAMWIVGETLSDEVNSITLSVDSAVASSFVITITLGGASPTNTPFATLTPTNTQTHTPTSTPTNTPMPPTTTPTATSTWTPTATTQFESEDINQDGKVDEEDIQICIDVFFGTETNPDIVARADVNGDGTVDVLDLQAILNAIPQE